MTDESLWSTRNVAEYAYCPRLFYFMEVEGIHLPSPDTELGKAVHKKVDKPSRRREKPAEEDSTDGTEPKVVRSLTLTSERLGLTATLDLAEIEDDRATPIEYRKGRPRVIDATEDDDGQECGTYEPWPTDRVQLGLQSLLLEEAGYKVEEGYIYYAALKKHLRVAVDSILLLEAADCLRSAKECAQGDRPLPLINDARCFRCSLQPLCLPDEINHQRLKDETKPRKIWPPMDEGIHVVAQSNGSRVGVSGQSLRVKDKDGSLLKEVPIANVESVALLGSVQISTQAVQVLADNGVPIAYLSTVGRLVAIIDPLDSVSERVRRAQVMRFNEPSSLLEFARALVTAKIGNQRTLLMRNNSLVEDSVLESMNQQGAAAGKANSVESLRGNE
ncbi:MAG: CRISPR-associated protein Cas4, partial [Nitrososphaerales archaeon]